MAMAATAATRRPRVLVDLVHAPENNPDDYNLNKCDYEYYNSYSVFRLFRHLRAHGCAYSCMRSGQLTSSLLANYDVLFINLMHEHAPAFTDEERAAVYSWIDAGGGLMVISEHTNAYRSAEKMNPLLTPLGLTVQWTSALDQKEFCTVYPGWLLVRHHDTTHPINLGVSTIHMMSGASIKAHASTLADSDGRTARSKGVSFLSPKGWADEAGTSPPDFYGDGVYTEGDETGPLPVVAVSEYGKGRVVVVGDQNIHGDAWLHFRHNFRHAVNAIEWLGAPKCGSGEIPMWALPCHGVQIGVDTRFRPYTVAKEDGNCYFGFFNNLGREHSITAKAVHFGESEMADAERKEDSKEVSQSVLAPYGWDDDNSTSLDCLILFSPTEPVPTREVDMLREMVWRGKHVILSLDPSDLSSHAVELLYALAPRFSFVIGGDTIELCSLSPAKRAELPNRLRALERLLPDPVRLESTDPNMVVQNLYLHGFPLARTQSHWGEPFVRSAPELLDAAFGCHATQSSEEGNLPVFRATNAVDGNPLTVSHTHPTDCNAWLEVDLGREVDVSRVVLWNRADGAQGRFRDLAVSLFNEPPELGDKRDKLFESQVFNVDNTLLCPMHAIFAINNINNINNNSAVTARYVRVTRIRSSDEKLNEADRNVLSLRQVQVITTIDPSKDVVPLVNAAVGSTAEQSSNEGNADFACNAINGDLGNFSHTAANDDRAWLRVDLGRDVDIMNIILFNRTDQWSTRLRDVTIYVSKEPLDLAGAQGGGAKVAFESPVLNPGGRDGAAWQLGAVAGGVMARYVLIARRSSEDLSRSPGDRNVLSLVEVQVWARPDKSSKPFVSLPTVDIARIGRVEGGRARFKKKFAREQKILQGGACGGGKIVLPQPGKLIVFMQDRFWQNDFSFVATDKRPRVHGECAVRLEYALVDWIKANVPVN